MALALAGSFSRYAADDYCTAGQLAVAGLVQAQSILYTAWSGRFAATLMVTVVETFGPAAVRILPGLLLLLWVAAAAWAVRELAVASGWRIPPGLLAIMATLLVYATLETTADMPQVLFWQTGALTYLSPLVLATVSIGIVARAAVGARPPGPGTLLASFLLALFAGGTSETFAVAQAVALSLALLGLALVNASMAGGHLAGGHIRCLLLASVLGALLAVAFIGLSPGNEVRQATASRTPLAVAFPLSLEFTRGWLRLTFARPHAVTLLLLLVLPAAIAATSSRTVQPSYHSSSRPARFLLSLAVAVSSVVVIVACMLPAFYALGSNPPGRAQVIPQYVLVCSLAFFGWMVGSYTAPRVARLSRSPGLVALITVGLLVLLVSGPLTSSARTFQEFEPDRAYAARWDDLDRQVRAQRAAGALDVTVPRLAATGNVHNLDFVGSDRHDWFNQCVARYYALSTIAADV